MEEVFVPQLTASFRWLTLCLIAALAGLLFYLGIGRTPGHRLRAIGQLVGPLVALVGVAGAGLVAWDMARSPTIVVADDYLIVGRDTLAASRVTKAFIETVSDRGIVGPPATSDIGVVEFGPGEPALLLSAHQYDVRGVIGSVRRMQRAQQ